MEVLFEILFGLYLEFWTLLVPEHKFKKWQESLLNLACIFVSLIISALIVAGICLITETDMPTTGIALLVVGGLLLTAQVVLFIIVLVKQIKKERAEKRLRMLHENELNKF